MRMPLSSKKASETVKKSLGSLDNVIVTNVKQKTSADVAKEKKVKKAPSARKKKA